MKHSLFTRRNQKSQTSSIVKPYLLNNNFDQKFNGLINPTFFRKGESFIRKEKTEVSFSESVFFMDDFKKITERKILNDIDLNGVTYKNTRRKQDFYEKKIEKVLDVPRKKIKNQPKSLSTIDKTNTNVYLWYFKNQKCERESCKLKEMEKERKNMKSENQAKSILKESKNKIDNKIKELMTNQTSNEFVIENLGKKLTHNLSQEELDWYRNKQESVNKLNFIEEVKLKTPPPEIVKIKTPTNFFYDLDKRSPTPVVTIQPKKRGVRLTLAQLRTLSISEKFYKDAKDMIFIPETNSFEYKKKSIFE